MYKGCIYRHWHINEDGIEMSYIGQHSGDNPSKDRWKNGKGYVNDRKMNYEFTKFADAIIEYGWKNFHHDIIEHIEVETEQELKQRLDEREKYWVAYYDSYNNGYNSTKGGKGFTGCKLSEEHKRKISESLKGKSIGGHSEEHKRKISESLKGRYKGTNSPNSKKVICLETKEVFNSVAEASEWCKLKNSDNIGKCCRHEQKSAGKHPIIGEKLHWMFYEEWLKQQNNKSDSKIA